MLDLSITNDIVPSEIIDKGDFEIVYVTFLNNVPLSSASYCLYSPAVSFSESIILIPTTSTKTI